MRRYKREKGKKKSARKEDANERRGKDDVRSREQLVLEKFCFFLFFVFFFFCKRCTYTCNTMTGRMKFVKRLFTFPFPFSFLENINLIEMIKYEADTHTLHTSTTSISNKRTSVNVRSRSRKSKPFPSLVLPEENMIYVQRDKRYKLREKSNLDPRNPRVKEKKKKRNIYEIVRSSDRRGTKVRRYCATSRLDESTKF